MRLTRRTLAALVVVELLAFAFLGFALMDRRAHQLDPVFGVNQWGYRGEARGEREPGEIRVALVGGSAVYEGSLPSDATLASQLFFELRAVGASSNQAYSVVNLAEPRIGADSYVETIRRYDFLDPEVVVILDGYDALSGWPPHARERSLVFRSVGYLPILPARLLGRPAWLSDPDGGIADVLQDGRSEPADVSCAAASAAYCAAMASAVRGALKRGHLVIVVSPPSVSARHAAQQRSLAAALRGEFNGNRRFALLDLLSAVKLTDPVNSPDGVHRTAVGNHDVGQPLAALILKLIAEEVSARPGGSR